MAEYEHRTFEGLRVVLRGETSIFARDIEPEAGASLEEIIAAMRSDDSFRFPGTGGGHLFAEVDGRRVVLASYSAPDYDDFDSDTDIDSIVAFHYEEGVGHVEVEVDMTSDAD